MLAARLIRIRTSAAAGQQTVGDWGLRPDASNPCRHIKKYPQRGETQLIADDELKRLYEYLDRAELEGLEHPFITLAIRLQFEFAARMSEILNLQWSWIDLKRRWIVWPDSKTGGMSKPISGEAARLLETAPRSKDSPYVCPVIFDPAQPMSPHTYSLGWARVLERAGIPHIGTHGIRHRTATDIANSGIPINVGIKLTAHKTITMFSEYSPQPLISALIGVASLVLAPQTREPDLCFRGERMRQIK
jgi:integrase